MTDFLTNTNYETMLLKEQVPTVISPKPNSFAGLMEMYETNYIQLRLLLGSTSREPGNYMAYVHGHLPVLLQVKNCTKHTSTILLTYLFGGKTVDTASDAKPDMLIRICHDALQAEVINYRCRLNDNLIRPIHDNTNGFLLCRWRMNRFLFKWLAYLRRRGYIFK